MASATPSFASTKETTNYARLCRLLVDVGTQALRDTFDRIHPPTGLHGVLKSPSREHTLLQSLRKKRILNATQWGKLYPTISSSVSSAHFDITLLMVLLRNICGLTPPATGWDNLPPASDASVEADIARVKFYRNNVYGHASQASVDETNFNALWQDISNALVRLGVRAGVDYGAGINKLKTECMDPDNEIQYQALLREWKKDDDNTKDKLDEIEELLKKLKKDEDSAKNKLDDMEGTYDPTAFIEGIRQLYNIREGWLAPFPWCEEFQFHLDSIFTRLKMVSRKKERGTKTDEIVSMYDIFRPHEECLQPRTVLLEGSPGMGKSTVCSKLAYDWATKKQEAENRFSNIELVLLLNCRDINSDLWDAIADQLLPLDVQQQDKENFFEFVRQLESKVLLILEGLDELPTSKLPEFKEIIQGRLLPKCHLVVTARQEVGIKVRKCCDSLLEIEGFTEEDAGMFVVKYFQTSPNLAQKLSDKLKVDNNLRGLTANPLNTALLCLFFEDSTGVFPENRTDLYLEIVQCILRRYRKKKRLPEINQDLIDVYKLQLKQLGLIALNGLLENNTYFEDSEYGNRESELSVFEFLSAEPGRSKLRPSLCFRFFHKSFQEMFAGFYLCCQLLDNEISPRSITDETRYFHELKNVLFFTCGILAAQGEEKAVALFESMSTQVHKGDPNDFVVALECIKECKSQLQAEFERVLGSSLELQRVNLELLRLVDGADVAGVLAKVVKNNSTLTELNLSRNGIGDRGCAALAKGIQTHLTLRVLNLSYNEIGDVGCAKLAEVIENSSTLTNLNLSANRIGGDGAAALAKGIASTSTLTVLKLSENEIGNAGCAKLAEVIENNSTLTNLNLSHNNIQDACCSKLAALIERNSTLTELTLSGNGIGDVGCAELAEGIKTNSTLEMLDLSLNSIGNTGGVAMDQAIEINSTLTVLVLSYNSISNDMAHYLNGIPEIRIDFDNQSGSDDDIDGDDIGHTDDESDDDDINDYDYEDSFIDDNDDSGDDNDDGGGDGDDDDDNDDGGGDGDDDDDNDDGGGDGDDDDDNDDDDD